QRSTVRDIVQRGGADWIATTRRELQRLEPRAEWSELVATLERDLPSVSVRLFERCLDAFLSGASRWRPCVPARALTWGLRPSAPLARHSRGRRHPAGRALAQPEPRGPSRAAALCVYRPRPLSAVSPRLALRRARRRGDRRALPDSRELRTLRAERRAGCPD